jgi:hypothetical protein
MIRHFLISLGVNPYANIHCYLATDVEKTSLETIMNVMMHMVEQDFGQVRLPIFLQTEFKKDDGIETVREVFCKCCPDKKEKMMNPKTKHHCAIWYMDPSDPDDKKLMDLH